MSLAQSGRACHKGPASNEQQPYPVGTSVDHLIGKREQRDQRIETEPLGSLEIRVRTQIFPKSDLINGAANI
jgi:hypothetical protein